MHRLPRPFALRALLLAFLVIAAGACAKKGTQTERQLEPRTTLRVDNRSWSQMTIYVIRGGQRVRLGQVSGSSASTFVIPPNLLFGGTSLRFLADPLGSNVTPVSQEITVFPGDRVELVIPN